MGALSITHWIIIGLIVLVMFGSTKIPQFMRGLGQGVGELKKGLEESKNEPPPPPAVAATTTAVPVSPPVEAPK